MSIVERVSTYLDKTRIHYRLVEHAPSKNSLSSAIRSNVPASQVAKAVMLEDHAGNKLMAILPASHKISLTALNEQLNRKFHLIKESAVYDLFADCSLGAVPPLVQASDIDKVYDDNLLLQEQLYLEGGDHTSLIQLSQDEFSRLMHNTKHLHFSHRVFH
ncbi:aminoacyl-tRNA deacylase [Psychromonas aquimarina]|uniref:aminoacyl-tRNA deacylase n=1 Tax=Psychromonas aquimarina TaxID=444919 RepID=UPI000425D8A9|nr:YbaK/EbsC family protein [Psychromonas aquimarina]